MATPDITPANMPVMRIANKTTTDRIVERFIIGQLLGINSHPAVLMSADGFHHKASDGSI
jgi:hypothetical protein